MNKMKDIIQRRHALMLIPSVIYALLHGSAIMRYLPVFSKDFLWNNALGCFLAAGFAWPLFIVLRASRTVFAVAVPILFVITAVASYYGHRMSLDYDAELIGIVLHASPLDIREYVNAWLFVWVFASLLVSLAIVWACLRYERTEPSDKMILFMAAAFIVSTGFAGGGVSRQFFPYNYAHAIADYALRPTPEKVVDISEEPYAVSSDMPQDLAVIVVISNGVRPDHLHLNGYAPQTTPRIGGRQNLVTFKDTPACAPFTENAVPCILGRTSYLMPEEAKKETSLISIFRRHGFDTVWYDMKGTRPDALMQEAAKVVRFNTSLFAEYETDNSVVDAIREQLRANTGRTLSVVRLAGSSWPFTPRVPERYRHMEPVCDKTEGCDKRHLSNAYDNGLVYLDYVLDGIMKTIPEGRPALVLFTSTSGQALGEDGYVLHGHSELHGQGGYGERYAALLMWASDEYVIRFTKRMSSMFKRQNNDTVSHDFVFHTLLDCSGFEGPGINLAQSLCR